VSTHKIEDLLDEGHSRFTPLQRLLAKSANQKHWTQELRALIDPPLKHQVAVTDIRGPTAYVVCMNAAAATRLRFLSPEILPKLNEIATFSGVRELNIRVANS
jgi:hypothetical protein